MSTNANCPSSVGTHLSASSGSLAAQSQVTLTPSDNGSHSRPVVDTLVDSSESQIDPTNPHNWPGVRRWAILLTLSCISLMVNMTLVICAPASTAISTEFDNHNGFLSVFYITVPNLGQVISPLYIGPLSERYGRVPICHIFNVLFLVFTMVSGFGKNFAMVIVCRFLAGASIASITLNPAITGDLFPKHKRGSAMAITSMIPILGSAIGPITGGYITQYLGWRWTFWMMAIITAFFSILMALVLKETYAPLLRRRALRKAGNDEKAVQGKAASKYYHGPNLATVQAVAKLAVRPFIILSGSRVGVLMAFYLSILFAYVSLLAATIARVFQTNYGFSESQSGLIYISLTIGILAGAIFCRFTLDYPQLQRLLQKAVAKDLAARPEDRLIPMIPGMLAFPIGLLVYGWSLQRDVHWIVPTLATALCGFSLSSSTTPIMSYIVDIFGDRSASAVAAVLPLRYAAGAFLPIAAPYMYAALGYGWGNSLLAFVLLAFVPIPLMVIVWPHKMTAITKTTS